MLDKKNLDEKISGFLTTWSLMPLHDKEEIKWRRSQQPRVQTAIVFFELNIQ